MVTLTNGHVVTTGNSNHALSSQVGDSTNSGTARVTMNGGALETNSNGADVYGLYALQFGIGNAETLMTGGSITLNNGGTGLMSEIVNASSAGHRARHHDRRLGHWGARTDEYHVWQRQRRNPADQWRDHGRRPLESGGFRFHGVHIGADGRRLHHRRTVARTIRRHLRQCDRHHDGRHDPGRGRAGISLAVPP